MAVLKSGSKGGPVKKLQEQLNKAGAKPKLEADGLFGKQTTEAVKAFQKKSSLKADGIAGTKTEAALGGGKGGGAGGGKGKSDALSSETRKQINQLTELLHDHIDDTNSAEDGIEKACKALKDKGSLSEQEKAKHLKPLAAMFVKIENGQKKLVASVSKSQGIVGGIDQKAADRNIKQLVKMGQTVVATGKAYAGYSKSTKQKSAAFLKTVANDDRKSIKSLRKSCDEIYYYSKPTLKFANAWFHFIEQVNKADKAS